MKGKIVHSRLEGDVLVIETDDGPITYDSKFLVAALLIFVAKGSGRIEPEESAQMIDVLEHHFKLDGPEALELLTRAITDLTDRPELGQSLVELARSLPDGEKEEIALMALKVIGADGHRDVGELEHFNAAIEAADISPEIVHRAFDRYFAQTTSGD